MVDPVTSLLNFASSGSTGVRILLTLAILVVGHTAVKLFAAVARRLWIDRREEATRKEVERREKFIHQASYILDGAAVLGALFYLNSPVTTKLYQKLVELAPQALSVLMLGVLGIIIIDITTEAGKRFLKTLGAQRYFREAGLSGDAFNFVTMLVKGFLYLILLQIVFDQMGIGQTLLSELVNASSWAIAFLIAGLLFYGFKDLFQNFAAGIYLKNSRIVRPGEEVRMEEESGEIRDVSLFSTTVDTDTGYTLLTPNREIMESPLKFKRTQSDLETMEDITSYFVTQHPSFCGPASAEMALEIFGYRHDQDEIGEKAGCEVGEGTDVPDLMEAVEDLTNEDVKTAWVEYDKIGDLGDEFKAWFNDGALIIPNFYKPEIFPEATTGHYVLSVGVEGSEVLVMDPSGTKGGVYYIEKDRLKEAMAEFDHKRGYIVLAPEGTTAYWRIKNDLIYSEKDYYDELSKTLESRLRRMMRQGRILKNVTPGPMEDYMEQWRSREKITRLWSPGQNQGGDGDGEDT
ncbi:MAG: mechanosensitive ion channel domain-containing protein [Candidatus Nanohaloarchaea archaeon]